LCVSFHIWLQHPETNIALFFPISKYLHLTSSPKAFPVGVKRVMFETRHLVRN